MCVALLKLVYNIEQLVRKYNYDWVKLFVFIYWGIRKSVMVNYIQYYDTKIIIKKINMIILMFVSFILKKMIMTLLNVK